MDIEIKKGDKVFIGMETVFEDERFGIVEDVYKNIRGAIVFAIKCEGDKKDLEFCSEEVVFKCCE